MVQLRHTSALILSMLIGALTAGCWADHGRGDPRVDAGSGSIDDAGPPPFGDAGPGCAPEPVDVRITECPPSTVLAGEEVRVGIDHGVAGCCDARDPRVDVLRDHDGSRHTIFAEWTVCSCCESCPCVGPREMEQVSLGVLPPGMHTVHAGDTSCAFWVEEARCEPMGADAVRAPTVLFPDQPMGATAREMTSLGCGCTPQLAGAGEAVDLSLCNCCDACLCVDPGYEAGWTRGPLPIGEHRLDVAGHELPVQVVERDSCAGREATGLEIVAPDAHLISGSEQLYWAVVSGVETLCCREPAPAIDHTRTGSVFELDLYSCVREDCECIGAPVPYEASHLLGALSPGTYTVRIDGMEETFTVSE